MKKIALFMLLLCCSYISKAQLFFPTDEHTGKVSFTKEEAVAIPKPEMFRRTKVWLLNTYKTSKFEENFKLTRKGKPVYFTEGKNMSYITAKYGFYVMYPNNDMSGLNMEQTFVMYTLTIKFAKDTFHSTITDMICYGTATGGMDMRPEEYVLEAYNEPKLNRQDFVQYYIIPQVTNSVRRIQQELYRNIRYGNITSE